MKDETLNALLEYIVVVEKTIKAVASMGPGAQMLDLGNATGRLYDALQNEDITTP